MRPATDEREMHAPSSPRRRTLVVVGSSTSTLQAPPAASRTDPSISSCDDAREGQAGVAGVHQLRAAAGPSPPPPAAATCRRQHSSSERPPKPCQAAAAAAAPSFWVPVICFSTTSSSFSCRVGARMAPRPHQPTAAHRRRLRRLGACCSQAALACCACRCCPKLLGARALLFNHQQQLFLQGGCPDGDPRPRTHQQPLFRRQRQQGASS